jgi:hypothetical protein
VVQPDVFITRDQQKIDSRGRKVAIYRLADGVYGQPTILDLKGRTAVAVAPEVVIDWEPVVAEIL